LIGKIAFRIERDGGMEYEYYVMDPNGSNKTPFSEDLYKGIRNRDFVSKDMWYCAYNLKKKNSDREQIYVWDTQVNDRDYQVTFIGAGGAYHPVWSPIEDRLAFVSEETGNANIKAIDKSRYNEKQITGESEKVQHWEQHPSWSPDGKQIVFFAFDGAHSNGDIWIIDADGNNRSKVTNTESVDEKDPVWIKYKEGLPTHCWPE
jgi:Tol biopolymer transport system component